MQQLPGMMQLWGNWGKDMQKAWSSSILMVIFLCFTQNVLVFLPIGEAVKSQVSCSGERKLNLEWLDWKAKPHFSITFNSISVPR